MAEVMAECRSDRVAAVTRAANVDALNSWSACRMSAMSNVLTASSVGFLPAIMYRKLLARLSFGLGATGDLPRRTRSQAATSVGICAVRRIDLRMVASRELSPASGSHDDSADTPVRRTSIGVVFFGSVRRSVRSLGGSLRLADDASAFEKASNSFLVGSAPCQSR